MNQMRKVMYTMSGMLVTAGMLVGSMFNDLCGYDAVGWVTIPILVLLAFLFLHWTRGQKHR